MLLLRQCLGPRKPSPPFTEEGQWPCPAMRANHRASAQNVCFAKQHGLKQARYLFREFLLLAAMPCKALSEPDPMRRTRARHLRSYKKDSFLPAQCTRTSAETHKDTHTHRHTNINMYIYTNRRVCICIHRLCVYICSGMSANTSASTQSARAVLHRCAIAYTCMKLRHFTCLCNLCTYTGVRKAV